MGHWTPTGVETKDYDDDDDDDCLCHRKQNWHPIRPGKHFSAIT